MKRRPAAVLPPPEYPRPVIPAGLTEDQQDDLLGRMMDVLLAGGTRLEVGAESPVDVRAVGGGGWRLDDDVIEF